MKRKPLTYRQVQRRINQIEKLLIQPQSMSEWDLLIHEYNALLIKECQMTGSEIYVTHWKSEYII